MFKAGIPFIITYTTQYQNTMHGRAEEGVFETIA